VRAARAFCGGSLVNVEVVDPQASLTPSFLRSEKTELVVFVGSPCLGKSTFYRTHFALAGYVHVNQDTLGSRPKCLKAAEEALAAGKSCVIGLRSVLVLSSSSSVYLGAVYR
jgi:AAA domain